MTFHIASDKEYKVGQVAEIRFSEDKIKCRVLAKKDGGGGVITAKYLYEMELVK